MEGDDPNLLLINTFLKFLTLLFSIYDDFSEILDEFLLSNFLIINDNLSSSSNIMKFLFPKRKNLFLIANV